VTAGEARVARAEASGHALASGHRVPAGAGGHDVGQSGAGGHDVGPSEADGQQIGGEEAGAGSVVRREVLDGPLPTRQLVRLEEALRLADSSTGLNFSVYVGDLDEPTRAHAEKLLGQLSDPARSVLLAVSPNQRILEIVTGGDARRRLPDRACKLAALSMSAAFSGGDLGGGIVSGIAQLADHAGKTPA
jgi:hypothetical protein